MRFLYKLTATLCFSCFLGACSTPNKVPYFKNDGGGETYRIEKSEPIMIKPYDKIYIAINTSTRELSRLYNLPLYQNYLNYEYSKRSLYTVDNSGNIDFPVLGAIHVEGLNRQQVSELIHDKLVKAEEGVKDPIVVVEFENLSYSAVGEVKFPGVYKIGREEFTILDALSTAGDLTINGKRKNVKVMRRNEDTMNVYEIDLTDSKSIYSSPAFYIQQNDVIYVEPNKMRARQSTANGNNFVTAPFWISIATLVTTALMYLKTW